MPDTEPNALLFRAVQSANVTDARAALDAGANINHRNEDLTPLTIAILLGNVSMVQLLINHGVDIHQRDLSGNTPLHATVTTPNLEAGVEIARLLIEQGSDVHAKGLFGDTPIALAEGGGRRQLIELFSDTSTHTHSHAERVKSTRRDQTPPKIGE